MDGAKHEPIKGDLRDELPRNQGQTFQDLDFDRWGKQNMPLSVFDSFSVMPVNLVKMDWSQDYVAAFSCTASP